MPRNKPNPDALFALIVAVFVIAMIILYGCKAAPPRDCHDELRYRPGGMYLQEVCG